MTKILLATSSKIRRELMTRLEVEFEVCSPDVDETLFKDEQARSATERLAKRKALAAKKYYSKSTELIISADQLLACGQSIFGKSHQQEVALQHLQYLSGKTATYYSAVCIHHLPSDTFDSAVVPTEVQFRELSDHTIRRYIDIVHPFDCAGSLKLETLGISLLERVSSDDPTAVLGLPLTFISSVLQRYRLSVFDS